MFSHFELFTAARRRVTYQDVDPNNAWNHPNDILVEFPNNAIKHENKIWKMVHITLVDVDTQDFVNERIQAGLFYDNKEECFAVRLTIPVCKDKMVTRYKKVYAAAAKSIDEVETKERGVAKLPVINRKHLSNVEDAHSVTMTKLIDNEALRTQDIVLYFRDMALTTEPFVPEIGDFPHQIARSLILGKEVTKNKKGNVSTITISPFVTFKLGILGSESTIRPTSRKENEAARELAAQLGGLNFATADDEEGSGDDSMSDTESEC